MEYQTNYRSWRKSHDNVWSCAIHGRIVSLHQDSTHLHYKTLLPDTLLAPPTPPSSAASPSPASSTSDENEALIVHYLNLSPNLTELYEQWSSADSNFKSKAPKFTGVRILRQDAWEALAGFICSSNNNIVRISQMMEKLCVHYGPLIGYLDSKPYYDMPEPSALTKPGVEAHLRQLGFGYRAKYLHQTALLLKEQEDGWLDSLRNPESPAFGVVPSDAGEMLPEGREGYRKAHEELLSLQGVGPKVADCVCLMGLGWGEAVPVDTHVWQIAQRDYKFGRGRHSSLTKETYDAVGNKFRALWGKEAGWAHSVLFTADLRAFSERLKAKVEGVEVKEETEEQGSFLIEVQGKAAISTPVKVKRRYADDKDIVKIEDAKAKNTTKKRRKA